MLSLFQFAIYRCRRQRGFTALWMSIGMVAVLGLCSLAVDYSMVQSAKTELRAAADAAARAAVAGLSTSVTQAQNNAIAIAANNTCAGTAVTITTNDIDFGTWDTTNKTFTILSGVARSNANAVRVNAKRTSANGNPIRLYFGQAVGRSTCDVTASAIALAISKLPGLTGVTSFQTTKGVTIASYNSSVTTTPSTVSHNNNACMGCNGAFASGASNGDLWGDLKAGPTCTIDASFIVHGTKTILGQNLTVPADPAMQVVTNPGGVSSTPNVPSNSNVTWPGGTYYFTSFTVGDPVTITFSGPAIVYMNGDCNSGQKNTSIIAYNRIPANLTWYMPSGKTFKVSDNSTFIGRFYGPNADFIAGKSLYFCGDLQCNNLKAVDNSEIYFDEALGSASSTSTLSLVK